MFGTNELIITAIIAVLCALVPAGAVIGWAQLQRVCCCAAERAGQSAGRSKRSRRANSNPRQQTRCRPTTLIPRLPEPPFDNTATTARINTPQRHPVAGYLLSGSLFTMASAFGFFVIFIVPGHPEVWLWPNLLLSGQVHADPEALGRYQEETAVIISAAFLGAYISAVWHLMRKSPHRPVSYGSFLVATMQILLACVLAAILRHVLAAFGALPSRWLSALYVIGFLIGIGITPLLSFLHWVSSETSRRYPNLVGRHPASSCRSTSSKACTPSNYAGASAKPILADAQNLATANPIELWAETAYELTRDHRLDSAGPVDACRWSASCRRPAQLRDPHRVRFRAGRRR